MTRKDFEAIAAAIRSHHDRLEAGIGTDINTQRDNMANAMADICQHLNPRFDRDRFLDACDAE